VCPWRSCCVPYPPVPAISPPYLHYHGPWVFFQVGGGAGAGNALDKEYKRGADAIAGVGAPGRLEAGDGGRDANTTGAATAAATTQQVCVASASAGGLGDSRGAPASAVVAARASRPPRPHTFAMTSQHYSHAFDPPFLVAGTSALGDGANAYHARVRALPHAVKEGSGTDMKSMKLGLQQSESGVSLFILYRSGFRQSRCFYEE